MRGLRVLIPLLFGAWVFAFGAFADPAQNEREGGILGTGIVGTITALGSIYVNGQHILIDPDLSVANGVSVDQASALRPGHTVAVIAQPDGDDWHATYIRQVTPLVGPLQISDDGVLSVMGTAMRTQNMPVGVVAGDWVAVSGLWQDAQVVASRIDPVSADVSARIEGSSLDIAGRGGLRIGSTDILGVMPQHVRQGDVVRVVGTPQPSGLQARDLETGVFKDALRVVLVEGFLSPPTPAGFYTVLGSNLVSFTDNPAMIDHKIRYFACGVESVLSNVIESSNDTLDSMMFSSQCLAPSITQPDDAPD